MKLEIRTDRGEIAPYDVVSDIEDVGAGYGDTSTALSCRVLRNRAIVNNQRRAFLAVDPSTGLPGRVLDDRAISKRRGFPISAETAAFSGGGVSLEYTIGDGGARFTRVDTSAFGGTPVPYGKAMNSSGLVLGINKLETSSLILRVDDAEPRAVLAAHDDRSAAEIQIPLPDPE